MKLWARSQTGVPFVLPRLGFVEMEAPPQPNHQIHLTDSHSHCSSSIIFDQDMANIPELEAGMRASKKGAVTYADYQESRLRHYHQTIDKYIAKGPLKP